jgi:hypothetical protein
MTYVNDIAFLYIDKTPEIYKAKAESDYPLMVRIREELGSPFSAEKTKVQFFIKKFKKNIPEIILGETTYPPRPHTRWLGTILNIRFNFNVYVEHWT